MNREDLAVAMATAAGLVGRRVKIEFEPEEKVLGYIMRKLPDYPYKVDKNGGVSIYQGGYGVILDQPIRFSGHLVQILVLTRLKCAKEPGGDPFTDLWKKGIYVQVHATSRYTSLESLWLFERILESPQETFREHFDLWLPGRVSLLAPAT